MKYEVVVVKQYGGPISCYIPDELANEMKLHRLAHYTDDSDFDYDPYDDRCNPILLDYVKDLIAISEENETSCPLGIETFNIMNMIREYDGYEELK